MIQDISPKAFHIEYRDIRPNGSERTFCFDGRKVLIKCEGGRYDVPRADELEGLKRYLFSVDSEPFFLAEMPGTIPSGCMLEDINVFRRRTGEKYLDYCGIEAYHLSQWYESSRFCGHCGEKTVHDKKERMLRCPACGSTFYPKISPCIIVAVTNGDEILLTRYMGRPRDSYALVAGFIETGELPEDAVRREVMEETGLKVKNIRYYKSQPWGFSQSLLLGFYAELDGEPAVKADNEELSWAGFVKRDEIPVEWDDFSLTNELITRFKNGET